MGKRAEEFNEKGNRFSAAGENEKAIAAFKQAIDIAPQWAVPYFNLGLVYKHQHRWEDCLKCNERAVARDPRDEAALWNMGIAATALGNWTKAREAWKRYGVKLPEGDGPVNGDFGSTPVRINPKDAGEVVWCKRIDPARAIIQSIPFAESGHRYGDLLLHDGEPKGYRMVGKQQVPVFNELQILMPSEFGTYLIGLENTTAKEAESLIAAFDAEELAAENWQTNTRVICQACSEGKPFGEGHQHPERKADDELVVLAVAATTQEQVETIVNAWLPQHPPAQRTEIECVVKPAFLDEV
jgi:tetratricopeptide (TPR) repeat protein